MQITRRPVLRCKREVLRTGLRLMLPDLLPLLFVPGQVTGVFRRRRIGNLRAFFVADSSVDVAGALVRQCQRLTLIVRRSFADVDPVAVVGGQPECAKLPQVKSGVPRRKQNTPAMR